MLFETATSLTNRTSSSPIAHWWYAALLISGKHLGVFLPPPSLVPSPPTVEPLMWTSICSCKFNLVHFLSQCPPLQQHYRAFNLSLHYLLPEYCNRVRIALTPSNPEGVFEMPIWPCHFSSTGYTLNSWLINHLAVLTTYAVTTSSLKPSNASYIPTLLNLLPSPE